MATRQHAVDQSVKSSAGKVVGESRGIGFCVVGMHRSGTSMVARILSLCGVQFGRPEMLLPPNIMMNPLDFFEDPRIVRRVNDVLLERLSAAWDDPPTLPDGWERDPTLEDLREEARACLEPLLSYRRWGWKDPRTTLLLPFWKTIVADVRFVICVRNPLDVAASLRKRDGIPEAKGLRLWYEYNRAAINHTVGCRRAFTDYDNYLQKHSGELDRLLAFGGINGRLYDSLFESAAFSRLRHHRSGPEALASAEHVPLDYKLLYLGLRDLTRPDVRHPGEDSRIPQQVDRVIQDCLVCLDRADDTPSSTIVSLLTTAFATAPDEHRNAPRRSTGAAARLPPRLEKLVFPVFDEPRVSIVIPTFNRAEYLVACLRSVLHFTDVPYELIVVDDHSDDDTARVLDKLCNVSVLRNPDRLDFLGSVNVGARRARARYLALLNNDTVVRRHWLSALLAACERYPRCGAVGAKLINMDGSLQEAGTIVRSDGAVSAYGGGGDAFHPAYNYVREVDYCSAACFLVRTELFLCLGGFDERYSPAYYEDVDLCFGLRDLGWKVVYQPEAVVFHHATGSRRRGQAEDLCNRNRVTFASKWQHVLARDECTTALSLRDRRVGPRALIVGRALAEPPASARAARELADDGHVVTYLDLRDTATHEPLARDLRQSGIEVFASGFLPFERLVEERAGHYDLVVLNDLDPDSELFATIRRCLPRARIIDRWGPQQGVGGPRSSVQ